MSALTRRLPLPSLSPTTAVVQAGLQVLQASASIYGAIQRDRQEEAVARVIRERTRQAVDEVVHDCDDYQTRHRALTSIAMQTNDPAERAFIYDTMASMRRPSATLNLPTTTRLLR